MMHRLGSALLKRSAGWNIPAGGLRLKTSSGAFNTLRIAVIAVGTIDAFHAIQIDSQVASCFAPLLLPDWTPKSMAFAALSRVSAGFYLCARPPPLATRR